MTRPVTETRVPRDLDVEERLGSWLTVRRAGYLSVALAGGLAAGLGPHAAAPPAALLAGLAAAGALIRPGGRPLDTWVGPALRYVLRRGRP